MKYVRIIGLLVAVSCFLWLHFWVLPDLAIVHFASKGQSLPETGYVLLAQERLHFAGYRGIYALYRGWSGVMAAWPYTVAGHVCGMVLGFILGDQIRRRLAIDGASETALQEAANTLQAAQKFTNEAWSKMANITEREQKIKSRTEHLQRMQLQDQKNREDFEEMRDKWEQKVHRAKSTDIELKKAKSKIRRLEETIERMEGNCLYDKAIDEH